MTRLLLFTLSIALVSSPASGRTFKTVSGVPIEATFLKLKENGKVATVVFKLDRGGREYEIPITRLRKEDQDWILNSDVLANQLAPGALTDPRSPFYKKPALYSDEFAESLVRGKIKTEGTMFDFLTKNRAAVSKGVSLKKAFEHLKIEESRLREVEKRGYATGINDSAYIHKQISNSYDLVAETIMRQASSKSLKEHVNWIAIIPHTNDSMAIVMLTGMGDWDWKRCTIRDDRLVKYPVGRKPVLLFPQVK